MTALTYVVGLTVFGILLTSMAGYVLTDDLMTTKPNLALPREQTRLDFLLNFEVVCTISTFLLFSAT
ncbi:hypothetical protein L596_026624 [Steinernema carpocapsae]|uniref:Uncharacterized protein n=1 Tax=Steinernema carpocapsae TaxID=34508 RepID=A0A4U5M224_STECR|nr:hypothetical protein L596_026624 [Steinernema carpocapsae]